MSEVAQTILASACAVSMVVLSVGFSLFALRNRRG